MSIFKLVVAIAFAASILSARSAESVSVATNGTSVVASEACAKKVHAGCRAKNPGKHGAGAKGVKHHKHEKSGEAKAK